MHCLRKSPVKAMDGDRRPSASAGQKAEAAEPAFESGHGGNVASFPLIRRNVLLAGSKLDHFIGALFLPKEVVQVSHSFDVTENDLTMLHEWGIRWR